MYLPGRSKFSCSGSANQHILRWSPSLEIGPVAIGRASSIKNVGCMTGLTLTHVFVPAQAC